MQYKRLLKTFLELVRIDSPSGREEKVIKYVVSALGSIGAKYSVDKEGNIYTALGDKNFNPVLLSCHLDTVESGGSIVPVVTKNGVIRSKTNTILGADNKVAVAITLEILRLISEQKIKSRVEAVFSTREETDGGIRKFDFKKVQSNIGIVADRAAPLGGIVMSSPSILDFDIKIKGKSAHCAVPEKGINALTATTYLLSNLKTGKIDRHTTLNIGLIKGGTAVNTIPESVFLSGSLRSFSNKSFEKVQRRIKVLLKNTKRDYNIKYDGNFDLYCRGYNYKKTDKAVKRVIYALRRVKVKPKFEVSFGASDANAFVEHGIKVVNINDGSKYAHTSKESISISSLNKLFDIYIEYVKAEII